MPDEKDFTPPKSANGMSLAVLAIAAVVAIAAGTVWLKRGNLSGESSNGEKPVKYTLHLDTFVLNLADPDQRSYLRVGIDLGLEHEPAKNGQAPPTAEVRDTILSVLAEAKVEDLLTAKGKSALKQELLRALQERLPPLGVKEVYFTEFLIQR